MNQLNYKSQGTKSLQTTAKRTTSKRFSHDQDPVKAMALFNSIVDKMYNEGFEYCGHIELSINEKMLIFKQT
jgi:hypothetical protein